MNSINTLHFSCRLSLHDAFSRAQCCVADGSRTDPSLSFSLPPRCWTRSVRREDSPRLPAPAPLTLLCPLSTASLRSWRPSCQTSRMPLPASGRIHGSSSAISRKGPASSHPGSIPRSSRLRLKSKPLIFRLGSLTSSYVAPSFSFL